MNLAEILGPLQRQHFDYFLMKAFEELHPGEPPLDLGWYLQAMCLQLERVGRGDNRRLVITVPPRYLKSVMAAVALPAWLLGRDPSVKIMVAHYSQDLARAQAQLCRQVMEAPWYRRLFPGTVISVRGNRATDCVTTALGGRRAVSVGGSITGFGADLIILDDCMKADEVRSATVRETIKSWYDNTLVSQLNDKKRGRIISIQQRLHEDDLPAYLFDKGFVHLNLPALATSAEVHEIAPGQIYRRAAGEPLNPAREDEETLSLIRREIGPLAFSAQYQQDPVVPEGNLIRLEWFGTYREQPPREMFTKVVQTWDTAHSAAPTADYSVCLTWGFYDTAWYLLDVARQRCEYPDLRAKLLMLRERWKPNAILIEAADAGRALHDDLKKTKSVMTILRRPKGDKVTRVAGITGELKEAQFLLPEEALWLAAFRNELRAFPDGKHDDQVDALSQFVIWQMQQWRSLLEVRDASGRVLSLCRLDRRPWGHARTEKHANAVA